MIKMQSGFGHSGVGPGSVVCVGVDLGDKVGSTMTGVMTGAGVGVGAQAEKRQLANNNNVKNLLLMAQG